ncbi:CapA family protein [Gracilibacillus lacisalsi]|uniref:CapA family protein n=1 Tax=Gracilibacillus lacisalsi TaxID=393087 RepID=UPI0003628419|nr:CapA family protein [Gracilibacillus lacisalsi]
MKTGRTGKFTLGATGDVLLHTRVYRTAKKKFGYDFNEKLAVAKPLFQETDFNIVNLESIIAGKEIGLSSFPKFNSPVELGYILKDYGTNIVNIANNHVLDRGEEGLLKSIENLKAMGLPYVGAHESREDQENLRLFDINGLKVCFLSYTRGVGVEQQKIVNKKPHLANTYHPMRLKATKDLIKDIRNKGIADVIIVSLHFGREYHLDPTSEQQEVSIDFSDAGADVIIGHHPHVLQPPAYILNSRGKETFAAYSLGNFYTGQFGLYRQIGAFMSIDIEKNDPESTMLKIDRPKMTLTFVDSTDQKDFKMHLLRDIVKEREHIITDMGVFKSEEVYQNVIKHLKKNIPDMDIS